MIKSKPKLPNNFKLNDNDTVSNICYQSKNIEIYKLQNEDYAVLLLDDTLKISDSKKKHFDIFQIKILNKKYFAFKTSFDYSKKENLLREQLFDLKGFDAVAGMKELKQQLMQDVILPILKKEQYEKFKITIPNGILLYGPPGCGKTYIVKKLAEELNFSFFEIKHSDVTTPYIHGGVGKIAEVFNLAKLKVPSLVFIDELDGLVPERANLNGSQSYKLEEVNEFLTHLNDAGKDNILVVGATNQPDLIDKAVLRSGRFDKKFFVMPPDFEARVHLFQMYLNDRPIDKIDYEILAGQSVSYSCSDIEYICNEASRVAVANNMEHITENLILEILENTESSI